MINIFKITIFKSEKFHLKIYYDLERYHKRVRREFDETEAYLRHRQRIHERERREKMKKQGKLDEYLKEQEEKAKAEKEKQQLDFENKMKIYQEFKKTEKDTCMVKYDIDLTQPQNPNAPKFEEMLVEYQESKKTDDTHLLSNYAKFDVDQKKVEQIVKVLKIKKKHALAKKARMLEDETVEDSEEFKPKMAGKTGLPTFFFSNLVTQHSSSFVKADSRNRMTFKAPKPKPDFPLFRMF